MCWRDTKKMYKVTGAFLVLLILAVPAVAQDESAVPSAEPQVDRGLPIDNVEFQGSEIRAALTFLADYGKANVVVAPDVQGTVTIRLTSVYWRDAMAIIGRTYDLSIVDDNAGYIRVMRSESYRKELSDQNKHNAEQLKLVNLETRIIKVSNSVAADMVETVKSLMSERGNCVADVRSNSLVLQEVPDNLPVIMEYIVGRSGRTGYQLDDQRNLRDRVGNRDSSVRLSLGRCRYRESDWALWSTGSSSRLESGCVCGSDCEERQRQDHRASGNNYC